MILLILIGSLGLNILLAADHFYFVSTWQAFRIVGWSME
jgi:hypothetical protein